MKSYQGPKRCLVVFFSLFLGTTLFAEVPEFETKYNEDFLRRSKLIGSRPEARLFHADGRVFRLSSARGKHTVLVFG